MSYLYPYGDTQQLNLAWFLAKFKELYEYVMQLDPSGSGADIAEILARFTEQYDSTKTYIPGDYCIHDGYIYKANNTTTGNFDANAWDPALPVNDVQGLRILLGGLSTDLTVLEQNAVTNTQYTPGAATADGLLRQTKNGAAETVMTVDKEPTANSQNPVKSGAVYSELEGLKGSLNSLPASRIKGKQIAIYGDSWVADYHGKLGADYLTTYTGVTVHTSADPGGTMARTRTNSWDSFNADIYIIIAGLNDLGANTTLTAFQQAIYSWVTAIRTVNANAEIYFVTPPMMHTATVHSYLYPLEMYRTVIWRLAGAYRYNVINALKWTDIVFDSDQTHPVLTDADKIGKHIVSALEVYGDEETHINDYSNIAGLNDGHLYYRCDGGNLYLQAQTLLYTLAASLEYQIVLPIANAGDDIMPMSFAVMAGDVTPMYFYHAGNANQFVMAKAGAVAGDQLYISGAIFPLTIRPTIFESIV